MPPKASMSVTGRLFSDQEAEEERLILAKDAVLLRAYAAPSAEQLVNAVKAIEQTAPFRHMVTPGGFRMSVAMTNCGDFGWITDAKGYRYEATDPLTCRPWPEMPALFSSLAKEAAVEAGFANFSPDACLINRYEPGARMTLHQDKDELDMTQPIVSVSLGLPAVFLFGGLTRKDRPLRVRIESGDVVVWGGSARLSYHGIATLANGEHPLTGAFRINLTFRKAK